MNNTLKIKVHILDPASRLVGWGNLLNLKVVVPDVIIACTEVIRLQFSKIVRLERQSSNEDNTHTKKSCIKHPAIKTRMNLYE